MIDNLIEKIIEKENPTILGLDPRLEYLPNSIIDRYIGEDSSFEGAAKALLDFNEDIIDSTHDLVAAVKLQIACYELYGLPGLWAFHETSRYAKSKGLIVIGDVKRNDIGSTAEAYSNAYIGKTPLAQGHSRAFPMDFITVNPYLGSDGIMPFIDNCKKHDKGIFILAKTSNPSSGELQDLITQDGIPIYQKVGEMINSWGSDLIGEYGYSSIGAVVGATYPEELVKLRRIMPKTYFLIPGYGAQGGKMKDLIGAFDHRGLGAIINASRSIMCAYRSARWKGQFSPEEFQLASRAEVIRMKEEIRSFFD